QLMALLYNFLMFPFSLLAGRVSIEYTFMPPYYDMGGWYGFTTTLSQCAALLCALYWVIPSGRPEGRAVSLAAFLGHFYLRHFPAYVSPWYVPNVTFISIFVIGNVTQHISTHFLGENQIAFQNHGTWHRGLYVAGMCAVLASLTMTLAVG